MTFVVSILPLPQNMISDIFEVRTIMIWHSLVTRIVCREGFGLSPKSYLRKDGILGMHSCIS